VNVESALAVSSDTFFYKIGEQILTERGYEPVLEREVRDFGFGSTTNIDLPYEYAGTVPSRALKQRLAEIGAITEESGENFYVGDNVLFAIGQGLLSATPVQVVNAYGALANGGTLHQPRVVRAILDPGTRDRSSSLADLSTATIAESVSPATPLRRLSMREEVRGPVVAGMQRVISGPGVTSDYYHKATGENLFRSFPLTDMPLAGKTGTAQGFGNLPWNDSSAFGAFSLDADRPYSAFAYLEKSGYGSQAAAPVVKCLFLALAGRLRMDDVAPAEPVDVSATLPAPPMRLRSPSCLVGSLSDARD
jgi:penicillin-binding protein 2